MNNFFIGLLFLFLFASCRNETSLSIQSAEDYLLVANDISCVVPLVVNASENPQYLKKLLMKKTDTSNTCASFNYIAGDTSTMLGLITFEIDLRVLGQKSCEKVGHRHFYDKHPYLTGLGHYYCNSQQHPLSIKTFI